MRSIEDVLHSVAPDRLIPSHVAREDPEADDDQEAGAEEIEESVATENGAEAVADGGTDGR